MAPGRVQEKPEGVGEAPGPAGLGEEVDPIGEVGPDRVPAPKRGRDPVDRLLLLALEGPEQPVPDDQRPPMVAVDVLRVPPVVDAMVGGCVEHPFEGAQPADGPGVNPELIEGVERGYGQEQEGEETDEAQGEGEDPA